MASSSSLLSPDQFLCSICLGVFVQPVSTPCGHNFCLSCIVSYWDTVPKFFCPICKHRFDRKPDLKVNTFISGLTEQLTLLQVTDAARLNPDQQQQEQQPVDFGNTAMCDICTDNQREAIRSCLQCMSSYCEIHIEPHERVTGLKRHTLVQPLTDLEDRICKEHGKVLVLFCRDEEVLLCHTCAGSHPPPNHHVTPIEEAYTSMKTQLWTKETQVQKMIHERVQTLSNVEELLQHQRAQIENLKATCMQDLTALVCKIQENKEKFLRLMEEKQKAAEDEASDFTNSIEQEVTELHVTAGKLRELEQTQDQLLFLQRFSVRSFLPHAEDLPTTRLNSSVEMEQIKTSLSRTVSQLQVCVDEMNAEISMFSDGGSVSTRATLKYMQQYQVDFQLDPDTAHPFLTVSSDRKQVRYTMGSCFQTNLTLKPTVFTEHLAVLSVRGFRSRRFYFEAFVGSKTEWCLGVATASVQRRGAMIRQSGCGLWALWFLEDRFEIFSTPDVPVYWGKVDRVGVFVDYDMGQVSFWDVKGTTMIYSFSGCVFTEGLYPYFNPCDNEHGSNLDPITLVPVSQSD